MIRTVSLEPSSLKDYGSSYPARSGSRYQEYSDEGYRGRSNSGYRGYRGRGRSSFNSRGRGVNNGHTYIPKTNYGEGDFCYELAGFNLSINIDDDTVSSTLFREFKQFGRCKVGIEGEGKDRVAVISFQNVEEAKEARRVLQGKVLFDRKLFIKPYHIFREEQEMYGDSETRAYNKYNFDNPPPTNGTTTRPETQPIPRGRGRGDYTPRGRGDYDRGGYRGRSDRGGSRYDDGQNAGHIPPEDDPRATRTLFVGNLDNEVTEAKVRSTFEKYGKVSDVEIKKQKDGYTAYGFVKFSDIQEAARAKDNLNNQYVGRNVIKIGYGKGVMSHRIWVGGLGSWTKEAELEREFDRFGKITKVDYTEGAYHAYVMYESLDAASAALSEMKGYPLGGADHRITVDFADPGSPEISNSRRRYESEGPHDQSGSESDEDRRGRKSGGSKTTPKKRTISLKKDKIESLSELCKRYPVAWRGSLVLKTNAFSVKLFLVGGDPAVAEKLLVNSSIGSSLKITQRLRLEQSKLDQLSQKLMSAGASGHCILVAMPSPQTADLADDIQHRPLKHLLQYFLQKQAAGIVALGSGDKGEDTQGVLHAFPPCDFAQSKLLKAAPTLDPEPSKEDYLVMVLVKGISTT